MMSRPKPAALLALTVLLLHQSMLASSSRNLLEQLDALSRAGERRAPQQAGAAVISTASGGVNPSVASPNTLTQALSIGQSRGQPDATAAITSAALSAGGTQGQALTEALALSNTPQIRERMPSRLWDRVSWREWWDTRGGRSDQWDGRGDQGQGHSRALLHDRWNQNWNQGWNQGWFDKRGRADQGRFRDRDWDDRRLRRDRDWDDRRGRGDRDWDDRRGRGGGGRGDWDDGGGRGHGR